MFRTTSRSAATPASSYSFPTLNASCTSNSYTERNPVRAGLVREAHAWQWSSAAAHCGSSSAEFCLDMEAWTRRWSSVAWREYLASGDNDAELRAIRKSTHTGRPLGSGEFVRSLEEATARRLEPQKGGRPRLAVRSRNQTELAF